MLISITLKYLLSKKKVSKADTLDLIFIKILFSETLKEINRRNKSKLVLDNISEYVYISWSNYYIGKIQEINNKLKSI